MLLNKGNKYKHKPFHLAVIPCCYTLLFHLAVTPCYSTLLFHLAIPPCCYTLLFHLAVLSGFVLAIWPTSLHSLEMHVKTAGEKDKTQRLADAAEDLQNCPDVVWYNSTIGMNNAAPLHVQPGTLSVQWSIQNHDADVHMRMVPPRQRFSSAACCQRCCVGRAGIVMHRGSSCGAGFTHKRRPW